MGAAVALAVGLGVAAGGAFAADQAAAVQARQQHFKDQGKAFKAVLDELKKDAPDKAVVAANAAKLKASSAALPTWFPKGSGPEAGVKTEAKPDIWSDAAGFAAAADRFKTEAAKFDQLAQAGDLDAVKADVRAVGGSCKNCHDKFRVPDKS